MSDQIDRATEVIAPIIANATACGYDPMGTCGTCRADSALIAQALANAGLLVTPEHDRQVAVRTLMAAANQMIEHEFEPAAAKFLENVAVQIQTGATDVPT